jgi:hypothetical protein
LILSNLLEVVNLVAKAIPLIIHAVLGPIGRGLCHILDQFARARMFHGLVKFRA